VAGEVSGNSQVHAKGLPGRVPSKGHCCQAARAQPLPPLHGIRTWHGCHVFQGLHAGSVVMWGVDHLWKWPPYLLQHFHKDLKHIVC
jgi:hypothetical protein